MPTYRYRAAEPERGCPYCLGEFEIIQRMVDPPLRECPQCSNPVKRVFFVPSIVIKGSSITEAERKIAEYEKSGMWSHAAELADKEAEKTKREDLRVRALEDYKKAGYDFDKYDTEKY